MNANANSLLDIFEKKMQIEVPLFQRQYVWSREKQWEPLWEDIKRKFAEYLEGRKDGPVHFLGAMVLDQKFTPTVYVERRQVIDGQQRLTTLQIFLAAFRDFCREQQCEEIALECDRHTINPGKMSNPDADRFKVWPTKLDQEQFKSVIGAGSRGEVEKRHPLVRRKYVREPDPRPNMVEAYLYFYGQISAFFLGVNGESPLAADTPLYDRLDECFQALKNTLHVVVIDLEQGDDAQVIFETLNARGEPLLPADLLRNFIFLRAAKRGEEQEPLYKKYWQRFDEPFWRAKVKQGRLLRPRSDLFIQHFLASRLTIDVPANHLFVEYKHWIEKSKPYDTVEAELTDLACQREHFQQIIEPKADAPFYQLATFLEVFEIRTAYPLLLTLLDAHINDAQWSTISTVLESYLLRRAVCGLSSQNYNRVFLTMTRSLRKNEATPDDLGRLLLELKGESVEWPADATFSEAWRNRYIYQSLNNPKIVHILKRLNGTYEGAKTEKVIIQSRLSVEHIMPQQWIQQWPLPGGIIGMTSQELWDAMPDDPRTIATVRRNKALHTIGNLTILTSELNSAVSNSFWDDKKPELLKHSILSINQQLHDVDVWDEAAIEKRAGELFQRALVVWPRG